MTAHLSLSQIIESIDQLSLEEQNQLLEKLAQKKQQQEHSLLNIPATLTYNPLLDEVIESIETYRQKVDQEDSQQVEIP
ncbi:MAG: hypothetical protein EWV92_20480 [Microcystis aeruginosa Ma_MB_S_20031200_S102]|uniref:Uncharacterized protein n=1 Tax=Microcystis aeruginosa Ma_MB_S_20031200_S102 TaxID=2486254 RepID=A0A552EAE2_MICAE|nr:MAG: hypothetical protein EWV79_04310 [Microcystis aeruginosa Ma_MB_S_20031200_S102D]TRU31476.1 MAG: hypothetical protein EWV92_20480 [Microcystis aeruginosa Ma_MB_S_20031200_S102]